MVLMWKYHGGMKRANGWHSAHPGDHVLCDTVVASDQGKILRDGRTQIKTFVLEDIVDEQMQGHVTFKGERIEIQPRTAAHQRARAPQFLKIGDQVEAYWSTDDKWYPGAIVAVSPPKRQYEILYDDGDRFWDDWGEMPIIKVRTGKRKASRKNTKPPRRKRTRCQQNMLRPRSMPGPRPHPMPRPRPRQQERNEKKQVSVSAKQKVKSQKLKRATEKVQGNGDLTRRKSGGRSTKLVRFT